MSLEPVPHLLMTQNSELKTPLMARQRGQIAVMTAYKRLKPATTIYFSSLKIKSCRNLQLPRVSDCRVTERRERFQKRRIRDQVCPLQYVLRGVNRSVIHAIEDIKPFDQKFNAFGFREPDFTCDAQIGIGRAGAHKGISA